MTEESMTVGVDVAALRRCCREVERSLITDDAVTQRISPLGIGQRGAVDLRAILIVEEALHGRGDIRTDSRSAIDTVIGIHGHTDMEHQFRHSLDLRRVTGGIKGDRHVLIIVEGTIEVDGGSGGAGDDTVVAVDGVSAIIRLGIASHCGILVIVDNLGQCGGRAAGVAGFMEMNWAIEVICGVRILTLIPLGNKDYVKTLEFLHEKGVRYVTCSGLITTGNATTKDSENLQLSKEEITEILEAAAVYCFQNGLEISFTSPGWIEEEVFKCHSLSSPNCGACLSNMAITPGGNVVPCQSYLSEDALGNMLRDDWEKIWNSEKCVERRDYSAKMLGLCPLRREHEN